MNNRFYTPILLAPLIFVGCNSNQPTANVPSIKTSPVAKVVETKVFTKEIITQPIATTKKVVATTTVGGIRYLNKPIVEEQGIFHIKSFMGTLHPTLNSAMNDGATTGMGVCSAMSMDMTNDYNALTTDTKIRRTALKYRNEKNKPDEIDTKVMKELVRIGDFKPVTVDAGNYYRVYKPLPAKADCLVCHGDSSKIPPKVSAMIKRKYPNDLAIGFMKGEFRGAVVAEIKK